MRVVSMRAAATNKIPTVVLDHLDNVPIFQCPPFFFLSTVLPRPLGQGRWAAYSPARKLEEPLFFRVGLETGRDPNYGTQIPTQPLTADHDVIVPRYCANWMAVFAAKRLRRRHDRFEHPVLSTGGLHRARRARDGRCPHSASPACATSPKPTEAASTWTSNSVCSLCGRRREADRDGGGNVRRRKRFTALGLINRLRSQVQGRPYRTAQAPSWCRVPLRDLRPPRYERLGGEFAAQRPPRKHGLAALETV
jgi:hypothetical protein